MVMFGALNNNPSQQKFFLSSLSSVGEWPVLQILAHLVLWVSRTGHPCASTFDEPVLTRYRWTYRPSSMVEGVRVDKEIAIVRALELKNLWEKRFVSVSVKWYSPAGPCSSTRCCCTPPHTFHASPWHPHLTLTPRSMGTRKNCRSNVRLFQSLFRWGIASLFHL